MALSNDVYGNIIDALGNAEERLNAVAAHPELETKSVGKTLASTAASATVKLIRGYLLTGDKKVIHAVTKEDLTDKVEVTEFQEGILFDSYGYKPFKELVECIVKDFDFIKKYALPDIRYTTKGAAIFKTTTLSFKSSITDTEIQKYKTNFLISDLSQKIADFVNEYEKQETNKYGLAVCKLIHRIIAGICENSDISIRKECLALIPKVIDKIWQFADGLSMWGREKEDYFRHLNSFKESCKTSINIELARLNTSRRPDFIPILTNLEKNLGNTSAHLMSSFHSMIGEEKTNPAIFPHLDNFGRDYCTKIMLGVEKRPISDKRIKEIIENLCKIYKICTGIEIKSVDAKKLPSPQELQIQYKEEYKKLAPHYKNFYFDFWSVSQKKCKPGEILYYNVQQFLREFLYESPKNRKYTGVDGDKLLKDEIIMLYKDPKINNWHLGAEPDYTVQEHLLDVFKSQVLRADIVFEVYQAKLLQDKHDPNLPALLTCLQHAFNGWWIAGQTLVASSDQDWAPGIWIKLTRFIAKIDSSTLKHDGPLKLLKLEVPLAKNHFRCIQLIITQMDFLRHIISITKSLLQKFGEMGGVELLKTFLNLLSDKIIEFKNNLFEKLKLFEDAVEKIKGELNHLFTQTGGKKYKKYVSRLEKLRWDDHKTNAEQSAKELHEQVIKLKGELLTFDLRNALAEAGLQVEVLDQLLRILGTVGGQNITEMRTSVATAFNLAEKMYGMLLLPCNGLVESNKNVRQDLPEEKSDSPEVKSHPVSSPRENFAIRAQNAEEERDRVRAELASTTARQARLEHELAVIKATPDYKLFLQFKIERGNPFFDFFIYMVNRDKKKNHPEIRIDILKKILHSKTIEDAIESIQDGIVVIFRNHSLLNIHNDSIKTLIKILNKYDANIEFSELKRVYNNPAEVVNYFLGKTINRSKHAEMIVHLHEFREFLSLNKNDVKYQAIMCDLNSSVQQENVASEAKSAAPFSGSSSSRSQFGLFPGIPANAGHNSTAAASASIATTAVDLGASSARSNEIVYV